MCFFQWILFLLFWFLFWYHFILIYPIICCFISYLTLCWSTLYPLYVLSLCTFFSFYSSLNSILHYFVFFFHCIYHCVLFSSISSHEFFFKSHVILFRIWLSVLLSVVFNVMSHHFMRISSYSFPPICLNRFLCSEWILTPFFSTWKWWGNQPIGLGMALYLDPWMVNWSTEKRISSRLYQQIHVRIVWW